MKVVLAAGVIVATCMVLGDGALLTDPVEKQTVILEAYISEAYDELTANRCRSSDPFFKRQRQGQGRQGNGNGNGKDDDPKTHLNLQKKLYFKLLKELRDCKNRNSNSTFMSTTLKATRQASTWRISTPVTRKTTTPAARPTTTTKKPFNLNRFLFCLKSKIC